MGEPVEVGHVVAALYNAPVIQHGRPVPDPSHDANSVGDEEKGHAELAPQS